MRKNVFGRKFKRDSNERKALFKSLLSNLVINGRIETTHEKAKAIKAQADKLVTKSRKEKILAKRLLEKDLFAPAISKMMNEIAPRFKNRNGGYTRIVKIGNRFADNAPSAIIEWVEGEEIVSVPAVIKAKKTPVKKAAVKKVAPKAKKEVKPKKVAKKIKK